MGSAPQETSFWRESLLVLPAFSGQAVHGNLAGAFLHGLAAQARQQPYDLLLIDPLAKFLPGSENHAGSIVDGLAGLDELTALQRQRADLASPDQGRAGHRPGSPWQRGVAFGRGYHHRDGPVAERAAAPPWAWSAIRKRPAGARSGRAPMGWTMWRARVPTTSCTAAAGGRWRAVRRIRRTSTRARMCCCAGQPGRSRPIASRSAAGWKRRLPRASFARTARGNAATLAATGCRPGRPNGGAIPSPS